MSFKRIIILGSERSGTNLLRVLLGNHKDISAPVAVHFLNTFQPFIHYYGDLNESKNATKLVDHFLKSANHIYTNWELNSTAGDIVETHGVNSFETGFDAMYKEYSSKEGKKHYVCKDNDMYSHITLLEKLRTYEDSVFYVYLHRDPRDQAVSWMKTPLFLHTVYDIATKWNKEQNLVKELNGQVEMYSLSYTDLVNDTETVMSELLTYLNLEIDKRCFSTNPENKESKNNELWKNLSKPIIKNNSNNYRNTLSSNEIKIIETICKENMINLNYELDTKANWRDFMGLYKKYFLPKERAKRQKKNEGFYNDKMRNLQSKLDLLEQLKNEAKDA